MKKNLFIALSVGLYLCACNTIEGAGTDIKETGKALERSAERNKTSSPSQGKNSTPYSSPHSHSTSPYSSDYKY